MTQFQEKCQKYDAIHYFSVWFRTCSTTADIDRIESHASRMLPGHQHLVEFQNLEATNSEQEFFFTFLYIFLLMWEVWKYWVNSQERLN